MKREKWLIVGEDLRLKELAKLLSRPERTIYYKKSRVWNDELNAIALDFQPDFVVLPIQPLTFEVNQLYGTSKSIFFAGHVNDTWKEALRPQQPIRYLEHEGFIWKNARLTAEGFIAGFYEKERRVIKGKRFVISGFGRISKMLASLLDRMGAEVCIVARSIVQVSEAKAYGYEAEMLDRYVRKQEDEYLINTIPAPWLTENYAKQLPKTIYDLASIPGCLNMDEKNLSKYELWPGLPGKYFAEDAAHALWQTIEGELPPCSKEKE